MNQSESSLKVLQERKELDNGDLLQYRPIQIRSATQSKYRSYWATLSDGKKYECTFLLNGGKLKEMQRAAITALQEKQDSLL